MSSLESLLSDACPDPCPVLLLTIVSSPFWALHLAGCICWFGSPWGIFSVISSHGHCLLNACPHLQPSSGEVCWGEQPRHFSCHPLPAHSSRAILWPILPCPWAVLCALNKAAALTRMHLLSLAYWPFSLQFSQPCSSAVWMHPHAAVICICQSASCCCSLSGVAAAAPGLAICLLHLLVLNQALLSPTASLAVPDQTSLSYFNPGNACSHLRSLAFPATLKVHVCPQNRHSRTSLLSFAASSLVSSASPL